MSNLSGLFDDVNTQVGNIAQQVGTKPSSFEPRVFAMIEALSRNVVLPIAGIILTFIACYELIEMITQHNNMAQFEPALLMKWIFKTAISVWMISNTFDIIMAVFDVTQQVVANSSGIISGNTRVNDIGLSMLQSSMMQMDVGPLFGLFLQSFFIGITMRILSIVIFVIVYGRMIEIYMAVSLAPIPMATWGNHEQSHVGQNYLRSLFALGFQGFLILICVAIYAVLLQNVAISGDAINSIWSIHSSKLIYPRELYQRGIQRKRVELIARDFNEYTANEPKISFRNGRYYVTDGQHTIEARILRNGGKDLPILCKVYTGLTMQQEALFFAEQNGHAAPLTAGIKLRAKVVGEDALSMAFLAATNRVGLDFNYDSLQLSDYRISCVGTALKLYNQMGEKIYCEALRLIVDAWEGKPDSFRAAVLKGVMYFVEVYHGEFNEERLIRALRSVHPMEIYRTGMDNPAKLPGWKKYVFPIYAAYNGKSRKDALPMKF